MNRTSPAELQRLRNQGVSNARIQRTKRIFIRKQVDLPLPTYPKPVRSSAFGRPMVFQRTRDKVSGKVWYPRYAGFNYGILRRREGPPKVIVRRGQRTKQRPFPRALPMRRARTRVPLYGVDQYDE